MLHSESRRLYSWWWDSHISPKNSKWLQDNLTDMDAKVKAMIKLIEEDADSFARRAEMYYKKRPELMKLVEEFYRAYRALAERYDHLTGELRQAHRTMAEAFPNQVPFVLEEDSPVRSSKHETEPHTPDVPHPIRALLSAEKSRPNSRESDASNSRRGLKQLHEMIDAEEIGDENFEGGLRKSLNQETGDQSLHAEVLQLSNENENLKARAVCESERAVKAESEVQNLKKVLANIQAEKDSVFLQYQICLTNLSNMDAELKRAQNDSMRLCEQAIRAEVEVQALKETLTSLEVAKEAAIVKSKESEEIITDLEGKVSHAKEDIEGLNMRLFTAEGETQSLNNQISRLESEKADGLETYRNCLDQISRLENKISLAEKDVILFKQQADVAENEVQRLRKALTELNEERESSALKYKNCLKRISELEKEISYAQEDVKRLNSEILVGAMKLKNSEDKCSQLEISNESLRLEAVDLAKKIVMKDLELSKKQEELERLQECVQDEHLRYSQIEAMLQTLQNAHLQSQEEHRALALELKTGLQMFRDLEMRKHELEDEVRHFRDENQSLSEQTKSSNILIENLQNEILCLREMKERLEEEVAQQIGQSNSLQKEILCLKEEIKGLNERYHALVEKLESVGVNPDIIVSSVKNLQDENSRLREILEKETNEKGDLLKKAEDVEELSKQNHTLERSLSELNGELEASRQKVRDIQETCQFVRGEKSILVAEKATLLSQLHGLTENMQKLLEKNAVLENSLSDAKVELEGLRERSKGLEEICQLLKNEKSDLVMERGTLVVQLANVEQRLECLEKRFTGLEEKYSSLEKENKSMHSEVHELRISLGSERQERTNSIFQSETRMLSLENHIQLLQEESRWRKKEFEDELEKAVRAQFEISILQKFIKDMEEKNYSLLIECQKHVEASKLADKLISELESENLEQQVEAELLLDEIEKLRLGIYHVFKTLEDSSDGLFQNKIENEQVFLHHIVRCIEDMKHSLLKCKDNELIILLENSVLLTLLSQLKLEGTEIESEKEFLEQELNVTAEKLLTMQNDNHALLEMNNFLESEVNKGKKEISLLEAEMKSSSSKQVELENTYLDLKKKFFKVLEENRYLVLKFSDLKLEKCILEEENDAMLQETLAITNFSIVLESFGNEKSLELNKLYEEMDNLTVITDDLVNEISFLRENLEMKEAENMLLKESVQRLETDLLEEKDTNDGLKKDILGAEVVLRQREAEIVEVEEKLIAEENRNSDLCRSMDALKAEYQQSSEMKENLERHLLTLSEDKSFQNKEIEGLREVNANLVSELCKLHEECEEQRIREGYLYSELEAKNNEFELWEAEATAFYFDLQISSICGALYENKVHELTEVCESLEDETTSRALEIGEMKGKLSSMENEIEVLKAQLSAYVPVIASLRDDVASLERNALLQTKLRVPDVMEPKCTDIIIHPQESFSNKEKDSQSSTPTGVQDLQKLQSRIKAVEKAMEEEINKLVLQGCYKGKQEVTVMNEIEEMKPQRSPSKKVRDMEKKMRGPSLSDSLIFQDVKPEAADVKKGILMKDIPLDQGSGSSSFRLRRRVKGGTERTDDQMLELWETAESNGLNRTVKVSQKPALSVIERGLVTGQLEISKQKTAHPSSSCDVEKELSVDKLELSPSITEPHPDTTSRKILDRLASDAHKLTSLHTTAQNLRRKLEGNKKSRKAKDVDLDTVKEQLQEVQETVLQLVDLNSQLMRNIEESSPSTPEGKASGELKEAASIRRRKVSEQARKGSEKIARLQLEVQKIEYILLRLEDEKKSKGRGRFSRSRTGIILRNFIYNGRKNSGKKKKAHMCGCFKPNNSDSRTM